MVNAPFLNILDGDCYFECGQQSGPCDYCGSKGLCCRQGFAENGCDGIIGGLNKHQCTDQGQGKTMEISNFNDTLD